MGVVMQELETQQRFMPLPEILEATWDIIKKRYIVFLCIWLTFFLPQFLLSFTVAPRDPAAAVQRIGAWYWLRFIPTLLLTGLMNIALITVSDASHRLGHDVGYAEALKKSLSKIVPLIWTKLIALLINSAALLATFLLVTIPTAFLRTFIRRATFLPALRFSFLLILIVICVLWVCLLFATWAVALRDKSGLSALRYSFHLAKLRWWTLLAVCVLLPGLLMLSPLIIKRCFPLLLSESSNPFYSLWWRLPYQICGGMARMAVTAMITVFFLDMESVRNAAPESLSNESSSTSTGLVPEPLDTSSTS